MPYDAPGKRVTVAYDGGADGKTPITTNSFAFVDNKVLLLSKTTQLGVRVDPLSAEAIQIQPGELCVGFQGGVHEILLEGALLHVSRGDKLWIDTENNAIVTSGAGGEGMVNEKQSLKVQGTGGTFQLKFEGELTSKIAFNATAAAVQAALEALDSINVGDVTVTGGPGNEAGSTPYVVVFAGRFEGTDVPALEAPDELTGGEAKVTVTTTEGGAGSADTAVPLGVVDEIDASRNPHVGRVNTDAWHAFVTS